MKSKTSSTLESVIMVGDLRIPSFSPSCSYSIGGGPLAGLSLRWVGFELVWHRSQGPKEDLGVKRPKGEEGDHPRGQPTRGSHGRRPRAPALGLFGVRLLGSSFPMG